MIVSLIVVLVSWFFTDTKASNELSGSFPLKIRSRLRGKGKGLVQLQAQAISAFPLTTFAGQLNEGGLDDGILASESKLSSPGGIWSDMWGNVYFSDTLAHTIMKVENNSGVMRVVGGIAGRYGWNGDGSVSSQTLFSPTGVTGKKYEDKLIFCDTNNHVVRELSLSEGLLTTIAGQGGQHGFSGEEVFATEALLSFPISVFVDAGGDMFIAELERCTIRKVVLATGLISTIAGIAGSCGFSTGGAATTQLLNDPRSVFVDLLGSVWIVDGGNKLIRRLSLDGEFSIVSNGVNNEQLINRGNSSAFDPLSLWVDKSSNVFVSDVRGVVNLINVMNGSVSLYASLNVSQMAKRLWQPSLYPVWGEEDTLHQLFVGDSSSNRMMRVILPTATPTEIPTVVPSMSPSVVPSIDPSAVPTDFPTAVPTYVPTAVPSAVPSLDPSQIPTAAPTFSPSSTPTAQPSAIPTKSPTKTPTVNPTVAPSAAPSVIPTLIPSASPTRNPTSAPTTSPTSIPTFNPSRFPTASPTCNPSKTPTYIPSVTPTRSPSATPTISPTQAPTLLLETVLVGKMYEGGHSSGLLGVESEISSPWSMWTSPEGDIYFTDTATHTVSQFNRSTGIVKIIAGMAGKFGWNGDGKATTLTRFHAPTGLTGDARQGNLLICDTNNHVVRTVAYGSGGMVSSVQTIAGQGKQYGFVGENVAPLQAKLSFPIAVYYDSKETSPYYGNLYIAELGRCTIRMISASTGLMSTIVGIPGRCEPSSNGAALSKTLNQPHSIYGDDDGNLVIADTGNHVLRWYIMATGELTTIGGTGLVGSGPGVVNDGEIVVNGVSPLTVNLSQPFGVWLDKTNNIFISEGNGTAIRMINYYDKKIYTISDVSNSSEEIDPLVLFQNTGRGIYGEQNDEANMLFIADALRNVIFSINLPFFPTLIPTAAPTVYPSATPTALPTIIPSLNPTPTLLPTVSLTSVPTAVQLIRTSGRVYTVAGGGTLLGTSGNGGPATAAQLYVYENPSLWKDSLGTLFIAEDNNRCIRKVVNGIISTIAGICGSAGDTGDNGPATNAKIATALNLWSDGTYMYFNSNRLRKVHLSTGIITAIAGGGTVYPTSAGIPATSAKFSQSHALWGNSYALYLSDSCGMLSVRNNIIRLVLGANPDACSSTNVVGMRTYRGIPNVVTYENGTQEDRSFMYVLDFWGIFTYDLGSKTVTRIVGSKTAAGTVVNGTVVTPNIYLPSAYGMFIDSNQNIFLLEKYGISYIDAVTKIYWTLGGHGQDYSNGVTIINAKVNLAMNMFVDTNNNNDIYYIERGGLVRVVTIT